MVGHSLAQLVKQGGLFAIVKPKGITSAKVVDKLKPIIFTDYKPGSKTCVKIGHGGTLDKNAYGVLVIGLGNGTKLLGSMLRGNKKYRVVGCLGSARDTMEANGQVTKTATYDNINQEDIDKALNQFKGSILQVPPIYSALKVGGQRMSDLAIQGKPVKHNPSRSVMVYVLRCTAFCSPYFHLDVSCGGGFYVRSLVHDVVPVGSCAHVSELCRTQQGPFNLQHALKESEWTVDNIIKALTDASSGVVS